MTTSDSGGREYFRYAGLGFEFALVMGLFLYGGHLIDGRWPVLDPWGLLGGSAVGLTVGLYHLAKEGAKMMRTLDDGENDKRSD